MARKKIIFSTEPQARKVVKQIEKTRAKARPVKRKDTGGKTTARTPKGIQKTPAQGAREKAAARKRIAARIAKAKKKQRDG